MMIGNVLRAGLQSGAIMAAADMSTQVFIEGKHVATNNDVKGDYCDDDDDNKYDVIRTLRWTLMGLVLHGPYFFTGFSIIDQKIGQHAAASAVVTWKTVAKKTAAAQFLLFPPYLVALFGFMGVLEKNPDIPKKIQTRVPEAFLSGCVYWPVANSINFKLVPNTMRVPYLALSAGIWNSYLSYANQHGNVNVNNGNGNVNK